MPVYQEKNKNEITKDGRSWYFRCYYTDMYGNRKQKISKLFKTKGEAKDAESEFLIKVKSRDETNCNIEFNQIYYEWLNYKKSQVKSTTYYGIKKNTQKHILTFFEPFKLHSIKNNHTELWKEKIIQDIRLIKHQNVMIGYLIEILTYARNNYDFDSKILSRIYKQKVETIKDTKTNIDLNYWTYEEFQQFIQVVDNDLYKTMFNLLYYTGLRMGEMIALTWIDIDFNNKTLRINKTFSNKIEGKPYIITSPKTTNSNRIVDLDDNLVDVLKKHYEHERRVYNFNSNVFVFGNFKHIAHTTFKNHLNKFIAMANVKKITPHGFRHSHVSLLINLGCDSRDVADRIGDTIEVVENTYYHMFPSKKAKTVSMLNKLNNENKR